MAIADRVNYRRSIEKEDTMFRSRIKLNLQFEGKTRSNQTFRVIIALAFIAIIVVAARDLSLIELVFP
ncbi:hypothetical protein ACQP2T_14200 [Nonomuraea sp. CA-143628]|uniref:hypothetical protein n=1 Tax=Nonomuraea sp. CA-143628 TaxID=3239997 RepID=UPI003D8C0B3E